LAIVFFQAFLSNFYRRDRRRVYNKNPEKEYQNKKPGVLEKLMILDFRFYY